MGSSNVWAALRPLSSAHTTALRGCFEENPRTQLTGSSYRNKLNSYMYNSMYQSLSNSNIDIGHRLENARKSDGEDIYIYLHSTNKINYYYPNSLAMSRMFKCLI